MSSITPAPSFVQGLDTNAPNSPAQAPSTAQFQEGENWSRRDSLTCPGKNLKASVLTQTCALNHCLTLPQQRRNQPQSGLIFRGSASEFIHSFLFSSPTVILSPHCCVAGTLLDGVMQGTPPIPCSQQGTCRTVVSHLLQPLFFNVFIEFVTILFLFYVLFF